MGDFRRRTFCLPVAILTAAILTSAVFAADTGAREEIFGVQLLGQPTLTPTPSDTGDTSQPQPRLTSGPWRSKSDRVYREAAQKFWNVGIRAAGNFSIPTGDWYEGVRAGVGFEGDILIAITHYIALRATVSRSGLHVNDYFYFVPVPEGFSLLSQKSELAVTRYFISAEYYYRINREQNGPWVVGAWTGLGAAQHSMHWEGLMEDAYGDVYQGVSDKSETKFATTMGADAFLLVSKNVALNAGAGIDIVSVGQTGRDYGWYYNNTVYAYIFDLKFGVVVLF
jgi:hypothetical protein